MNRPTTTATAVRSQRAHRRQVLRRAGRSVRGWLTPSGSRGQTGATTVQVVLIAPLLMLTLMAIVQAGLLFYARAVVEAAAQEGAAEARRFDGTAADAQAQAENYLTSLGPRMFEGRSIQVSRGAETAEVTVTGSVISLVPFFDLEIEESASGPVERYVPPAAGAGAP